MKIKIALCQINVVDNKEKNIENATSMILKAVKQNADFMFFPKCLIAHIPMKSS